ncbi:calcium-binding and coiled-coil domain-containing protein 1 isoform X1 [Hippocampus zosterae]|uniref:calcium-binding and coiled-coil domain-containing protein 1 isoform X1 n=1 Tax=Hippocampus zosterae TaxID=109293 RepID=UPI00223E2BFD|nr:calcium-binding and coiled-coil domain-containing protein 1 isoform X1 [Hippocampus zosterae]XP_051914007.1 calcium-binding and coiled-coil domain-containing protein 1 isoform X1 [Hippocampus zosterae]
METTAPVEFRNVGCSYFPQSRVDCHYTLSSLHTWASSDWIGLFKVGWSSVKDYHTFVWAPAPANYEERTEVNCCVQFQASYLPNPSAQEYEFVYIDAKGEVCSRSSKFTFCAPKPLEDLVTVEEEPHGEEEGTDILLVVPRTELLKSRLQECLRKQADLLQMQEVANEQKEKEREDFNRERLAWRRLHQELHSSIGRLHEELKRSQEKNEEMARQHKEEIALGECLAQEKKALLDVREANKLHIEQLQKDIKTLTQRALDQETELERIKERAKRAAAQWKAEQIDRKILQTKLEQTEGDLRSLSKEFQDLRNSLAQRDASVLQLQNTISTLTQKLTAAHRKEAWSEAMLREMSSLQERLDVSERAVDVLKNDLSETVAQRDCGQAGLHQARLQAAQLTLQLADSSLALREGRAQWAQQKQSLQHKSEKEHEHIENLTAEMHTIEEKLQEERTERVKLEVELGREKDCNRVQLSEMRRELQELKASLRVAHKEKERLCLEKKDLMDYICQLEQKMGTAASAKWSAPPAASTGFDDDASSDLSDASEDRDPRALQSFAATAPLGNYGLCEQGRPSLSLFSTPPPSSLEMETSAVVISQPAPISLPHEPPGVSSLALSSDSEEEPDPLKCGRRHSYAEERALFPDHRDLF